MTVNVLNMPSIDQAIYDIKSELVEPSRLSGMQEKYHEKIDPALRIVDSCAAFTKLVLQEIDKKASSGQLGDDLTKLADFAAQLSLHSQSDK